MNSRRPFAVGCPLDGGRRRRRFKATGLLRGSSARTRLLREYRRGRGEPIQRPPLCRSFDLALRARFDSDAERQDQPKRRSRAKNSSAGMPSSRSASSRAARRSASSWGESFTTASSPRARMVTAVPSGRERSSTTTLPPTTVPETTCMGRGYPSAWGGCNLAPNVRHQRYKALSAARSLAPLRMLLRAVKLHRLTGGGVTGR